MKLIVCIIDLIILIERLKSVLSVGHVLVSFGSENSLRGVPDEDGSLLTHTDDELLIGRNSNLNDRD